MTHYLLALQQPDGPPPAHVDLGRIMADVGQVNAAMKAAGAWVFGDGLHPAHAATVVRPAGAETMLTDGPYLEGSEHIGGLVILRAKDLDEALAWARLLAVAATLPVEVRPFASHS